jgi:hypothetical protein
MKSVIINGEESGIDGGALPHMADLIELIKASIDPEHMITSLLIDGRELGEADWTANTSEFQTSILEVETGLPEDYVAQRIQASSSIVGDCYLQFRNARKSFQDGSMQEGNEMLIQAVNNLKAFFEWYGTMLELIPEERREVFSLSDKVENISETCKKICQQQLYQSWWALGETLEKELEPELDQVEDFCRKIAKEI